jgi:hypothetical protein
LLPVCCYDGPSLTFGPHLIRWPASCELVELEVSHLQLLFTNGDWVTRSCPCVGNAPRTQNGSRVRFKRDCSRLRQIRLVGINAESDNGWSVMMKDKGPALPTSSDIVQDRVRIAFPQDADEAGRTENPTAIAYLSELRSRMKDLSESSRRTVVLLLLVAAVFQLLDQAAVVSVQAGPFQIRDLSLIQRVLPLIFAYLIYDATVFGVRYLYSLRVASEIARSCQPSIKSSSLDALLNPQGSPLFGPMLWHRSKSRQYRLLTGLTLVLRLGSLLVPLMIEVYAFYRLFEVFGRRDEVIWISALISFGFIVLAAMVILTGLRDGLIRPRALVGPGL